MAKNNNLIKNKVNSKEYWQYRAEKTYLEGEKDALKVSKHLKTLYDDAVREINEKINSFYGKYANETGLTLDEAKQLLDKNELKDFKSYLEKMISIGDKNNFSQEEMAEFKRLYNKAKITRLEELQTKIRGEIDKLTVNTNKEVEDLLASSYEEGYYKTLYNTQIGEGLTSNFSGLNKRAIEKAVNTKYLGSNYSSRIWQSTNTLMNTLKKEIPRGLVLGYNPKKLAREVISPRVNKTLFNNTVRLIRTEYSHILNQATLDGYKENGIKQYKISTALDNRTCDDCSEFEGKIINIYEAIEGVDLPPFHPNCRCTTIPYFEEDYIDKMTNEELDKIGFITYQDWLDNLVTFDNGKVNYVLFTKENTYDENNKNDMDNINKMAKSTYNLANRYLGDKGLWSGDIKLVSDNDYARLNFIDKNYLLEMTETTSPYLFLHEQIHGHSAVKQDTNIYKQNARIEEGTIELLARSISNIHNIEIYTDVNPIYNEAVSALQTLNKSLHIADSDLELGQKLIKVDLDKRYDYLEKELDKYTQSKGLTQMDDEIQELQKELDKLYGGIPKQ